MYVFIIRRLLSYIPVLFGLSIGVFGLARLVPGDVVDIILSNVQTPEQAARLRLLFGLDRPLYEQYWHWLLPLLRGDSGISLFSGRPVLTEILTALRPTVELATAAMVIALCIGLPLGVLAAVRHGSIVDVACSILAYLGISSPVFWSGTLLILLFSIRLSILPSGGYTDASVNLKEALTLLVLPALTLGLSSAAPLMRVMRSSLLEVLRQEYITVARAKGLREGTVIVRHAMRSALITVLTVAGVQLALLLGGAVIVEAVFTRPGIGRLLLLAVLRRDYPLIQGLALFIALAFMTVNLLVDVLYTLADPRIRVSY